MGYTHYWYFPSEYEVNAKTWKKIVDDFNKILDVDCEPFHEGMETRLRFILDQK